MLNAVTLAKAEEATRGARELMAMAVEMHMARGTVKGHILWEKIEASDAWGKSEELAAALRVELGSDPGNEDARRSIRSTEKLFEIRGLLRQLHAVTCNDCKGKG